MEAALKRFLQWMQHPLVRVITTAGCVWLLIRSMDLSAAFDNLLAASPFWLAFSVALTGLVVTCQVIIWGLLLRCNGHKLPWTHLWSLYAQGLFWGHVLPGGVAGDAVRTVKIAKQTSEGDALASLAGGRLAEGFGVGLWAVLAMIAMPLWFGMLGYLAALLLVLLLAGFWYLLKRMEIVARLVDHEGTPWRRRIAVLIGHFGQACAGYSQRPRWLIACLSVGIAAWAVNLLALIGFSHAVGAPLDWQVLAIMMPIVSISALAPFAINGFGLREGMVVAFLAKVGVTAGHAFALAILIDLQLIPFVIFGALAYLLGRRSA